MENGEKPIVVNDLLSYMVCKYSEIPKEKLLNGIRQFYSDEVVTDAQNMLLSSIPKKRSTRRSRCVKNPDPLVVIYDSLQLIPKEDLPTFACKNLNNIPIIESKAAFNNVSSKDKENLKVIKTQSNKSPPSPDFVEVINEGAYSYIGSQVVDQRSRALIAISDHDDVSIYKKEQRQMRLQISEMVAIINDLKEGLKNFTDNLESANRSNSKYKVTASSKSSNLEISSTTSENTMETSDELNYRSGLEFPVKEEVLHIDIGDDSSDNSLALLQKLIDEDDRYDIFEETDEDENSLEFGNEMYTDYCLDLEGGIIDERSEHLQDSEMIIQRLNTKVSPISKNPSIVVVPDKVDNKLILIREESKINSHTLISNSGLEVGDTESSIEISATSDCIEEIEESSAASIEIPISPNFIKAEGMELAEKCLERHQCPICEENFYSIYELRKHNVKEHITKSLFDCTMCHKSFVTRSVLHSHFVECLSEMRKKVNLEDRTCQICGSFYAYPKSLKSHMMFHSESRQFACPHCTLRYHNSNALELHIKNNHNSLNTYFCSFCPLSFISNHFLVCHTWSHTGEKPFWCGICNFRSATKTRLRTHLQTHASQKKVECKICNFSCLGFSKLTKHLQHSHSNPLVCPRVECRKKFVHYFQYKRHCESHLENSKFKCSLCLYRTSVKSSELKHIKTHLNPTYQCPQCSVNLASKHNVSRHLKSYCMTKHSVA